MRKQVFLVIAIMILAIALANVGLAFAQDQASTPVQVTLSWQDLVEYLFIGALFGIIHDLNDNNGLLILPSKKANGQWDLGVISPALFGAAAGLIAQYATSIPVVNALFPNLQALIGTAVPSGILAAALGGYLYAKLFAALSGLLQTTTQPTPQPVQPTPPTSPSTPTQSPSTPTQSPSTPTQSPSTPSTPSSTDPFTYGPWVQVSANSWTRQVYLNGVPNRTDTYTGSKPPS